MADFFNPPTASPVFTGTVTFPDGSTWNTSGLTMAVGKTIAAQAVTATTLALGGAAIGTNALAWTGTANGSGALTIGSTFTAPSASLSGSTALSFAAAGADILDSLGGNRLRLGAAANQILFFNNTGPKGVILDFSTDGIWNFLQRDGATKAPITAGAATFNGAFSTSTPTTVTAATHTTAATDTTLIYNFAGTVTETLPAAASFSGRQLYLRTITANTVVSASANVVPLAGGASGTAILAATAGKWALLQSDGANWQIMAAN